MAKRDSSEKFSNHALVGAIWPVEDGIGELVMKLCRKLHLVGQVLKRLFPFKSVI